MCELFILEHTCYTVYMTDPLDAYSEFGYYIHRIVALIDKRGDALFREQLGISLRQFLLLRLIEADPKNAPSQQMLADRLGIAKSAVSRHIDIAKESGWITVAISEASRKQHALGLTAKGQQLLGQANKLLKQSEIDGFSDLPKSDVEAMLRVMKSLHAKLLLS